MCCGILLVVLRTSARCSGPVYWPFPDLRRWSETNRSRISLFSRQAVERCAPQEFASHVRCWWICPRTTGHAFTPRLMNPSCADTRVASDISARCEDAPRCNAQKGDCQVAYRRHRIGLGHEGDVIPLHRLHEALRHAVALWAAHWRRQWFQPQFGSKRPRALGNIT
jgi:hypothetical protein